MILRCILTLSAFALALLLTALLTACAGTGMMEGSKVTRSLIEWVDADPYFCGGYVQSESTRIAGCASLTYLENQTNCTVTMRRDSPDWIVAHEFRHCYGWVHK